MAVYYIEFYFLKRKDEDGERRRENTIKNMLPCLRAVLSPPSPLLSKTLF